MIEQIADTQPIRATNACRTLLSRLVRGLLLSLGVVGIFVSGFAVGSDPELSASLKAVYSSSIDLLRASTMSMNALTSETGATQAATMSVAQVQGSPTESLRSSPPPAA